MSHQASRRQWVLACGGRYWPRGADAVTALPMPSAQLTHGDPGELAEIALPDWASDLGVDGALLAFSSAVAPSEEAEAWQRCDWIAIVWHMLAGSAEREHEARHGPVLSYAFRLPRAHHRLFDSAWANRIFLFLRRWAARERSLPEEALFGPLPAASIVLTHDVDAIDLTPEIRAKQTVFQLANGARALLRGDLDTTGARLRDAARFAFSAGDFRTLGKIREMEQAAGLRSILHFYGGPSGLRRGSPRRLLIDPGYDIASPYLRTELAALREGGWTIGLHQSFDAWEDASRMQAERARLADAAGVEVAHCRQHWLHFSWERTWAAQEAAGLSFDTTLGFNDRPGFRAGHALRFHPWDFSRDTPMRLAATPMIFMDSHFYDYGGSDRSDIAGRMKRWLDEVRAVRGEATVNWHNHTITKTYGWGAGYEDLLSLVS